MIIQNIHLENSTETYDILVKDGRFEKITLHNGGVPAPEKGDRLQDAEHSGMEEVIDGSGCMILPPFIESHVHLDSTQTAGDPAYNMSGTLFEGIELWSVRKQKLTKQDVKERARKTIEQQVSNGVQYVRSHVDVTDPSLTALEALLELKEELHDSVELQLVAFPQEGILSYPNGKELMEDAVRMGADCVGAIPHFEFTREYSVESLNYAMKLAEKYDRLVDVHCDEIDDEASRGLETLACRALESGMYDRVTASHTTAMHSYNNAYVTRLMRLLKMSRINFVSNPIVNTHLQGRADNYPKRRGITRVKELLQAGLNVSFGHDDIRDPWYPMGTGDMRDTIYMGIHVCHMMGYEEIMNSYRLVTHNAAKTLHLGDGYGIREGNAANFIILDAPNFYQALNEKSAVLYSYHNGRLLAKTKPAEKVRFL